MSVNTNQSFINPTDSFFALAGAGGSGPTGPAGPTGSAGPAGPTGIVAGVTNLSTLGVQLVTVGITGCVSTSVVVATYVHPGAGAAAQAFNTITPGANQVIFDLAANTGAGESINWIARL